MSRQFPLKWLFVSVALLALLLAFIRFLIQTDPGEMPEAIMMQRVSGIQAGMKLDEVTSEFGFDPDSSWLNKNGTGFVLWRFEVSDVAYEDRRASCFVKFEEKAVKDGFLLYPLDAAGGGMVF